MRARLAVLGILAYSAFDRPALAQPNELTPGVAQDLVVHVVTGALNRRGEAEWSPPSSGTIFGFRRDTLYIVISNHQLDSVLAVAVALRGGSRYLPAEIQLRDEALDIAVLAVTEHTAEGRWQQPRIVPRKERIVLGEPVFALGCSRGRCWDTQEAANLSGTVGARVIFRPAYLRPGMSGGPLVAADGALLGIIVVEELVEGEAVYWPVVVSKLRENGYPVNLPTLRGYRFGEVSIRVLGAAFPTSGVNSDGRHLQPGWRAELSLRVGPSFEVATGLNRVSFAASPFDDREADWEEAYAHVYFHVGGRFHLRINRWSIGRGLPDVLSGGFDLLFPMNRSTRVITLVSSDTVNLQRGEYVAVRSVVRSQTGISLAYRLSYRVALSDRSAVVFGPALYLVNFDYLDTSPARAFLEIGGEFRLGVP